jgi:hypothetical protein
MAGQFTSRRYAGTGTIGIVRTLLILAGVAAMIAGPVYWINGLTRGPVTVHAPLAEPEEPVSGQGLREGVILDLPAGTLAELTVWDPSKSAWLLWRSDDAINGLAIGLGCLALSGIVGDIGMGRPFSRRNARRFVVIAALVGVVGILSQILNQAAIDAAITSAGLNGPDGPFRAGSDLDMYPIGIALLILVLAEAFRVGAAISEDVEGLV